MCRQPRVNTLRLRTLTGLVHAWVGQIVTFFAYRPPSRPVFRAQPDRVSTLPEILRMQAQTAARYEDILAHVTLTGAGSRDSRLLPIWDQTRVWDPGD